jgi:hypothetical protein
MKLVTCMITAVLALSFSCGGTQTTQVKQVAYDCATVDIGRTIPEVGMTIFQDVMAIIQAGTDGWTDKLLEIGAKYGKDTLACAAKATYDALTARPVDAQASARTQASDPSAPARRAQSFISAQGFSYR